jgi:hypothetical protein
LGDARKPFSFRLLEHPISNYYHLVCRQGIFYFAVTPLQHVAAQLFDVLARLRQVVIAPVRVFWPRGGVRSTNPV